MIHNDNDYANECFVAFLFQIVSFSILQVALLFDVFLYLLLHFTSICHVYYSNDVFVVYNEP